MTETPRKEFEPSEKPRIFSLHGLPGRLSGDLANVGHTFLSLLRGYEKGKYSQEEMRDQLRNAKTFEDYFRAQLEKYNKDLPEESQLYDEDASLQAELKMVDNPQLIEEFNKKIMKLRECADEGEVDKEKIRKIINEEIDPLIYGKEK